jgi:ferredoxin
VSNVSLALGVVLFLLLGLSAEMSWREGEPFAARRLGSMAVLLALPYLAVGVVAFPGGEIVAGVLVAVAVVVALVALFPLPVRASQVADIPTTRIDERDIMFSRAVLEPGSERFEEYYRERPEHRPPDDAFARKLGALSVGVAELQDYHLYTTVGRGPEYGEPVHREHDFGIAVTVEMSKEMVDRAPKGTIAMESGQQYLMSGVIALQMADLIRRLGYPARAHIDGNYRVVCPLVARDAGLGEIGRMGLLMTPELGPRVRLAVVTTDIPLIPDSRKREPSTLEFCRQCMKCAHACPSNAIPFEDRREIDGATRWQIDSEACYTLWCKLGTDCGRCMSVCPYSHPDNLMHNLVRAGIRNSRVFLKSAVWMDDFVYGAVPPSRAVPEWMRIPTEPGDSK